MKTERYMARMSWFAFLPECWKMRIRRSATGRCLPSTIGAETISPSGCECEAAKNRGAKPAEMPGSHRVFRRSFAKKIRPKIKKHCQKQAKGDMIDKNSKRKRVGFAIAIYPREGTETRPKPTNDTDRDIAIYPREGTETGSWCWCWCWCSSW